MRRSTRTVAAAICCLIFLAGCEASRNFWKTDSSRFLSPDKLVKAPQRSPISPILPNVGLVDQSQELVPNAEFPQEGDWTWTEQEYAIGPTDIVDIYILDLYQEGAETPMRRDVSAAGYIDLPLLPERVKASGLTVTQLKQEIERAYEAANILRNPQITVMLAAGRQNVVSVLGAVSRPGQYGLPRRDMRLLEVLALAGGVVQPNIRYIYVIRPQKLGPSPLPEQAPAPAEGARPPAAEAPAPPAAEPAPAPTPAPATGPPGPTESDIERALRELEGALPERREPSPDVIHLAELATGLPTVEDQPAEQSPWRFEGGRWVRSETQPVQEPPAPAPEATAEAPQPQAPREQPAAQAPREQPAAQAPPPERGEDPFGWRKVDQSDTTRVIAIDLQQLENGQARMNIVIRENDIIQIPYIKAGEFYIGGEVLRPGVYSLAGRKITIKQALAASGNLGPLAWPENSLLVRRLGDYQEQYIPVDLEAIFRGDVPDVYLKADDQLWVGTEIRAIFYAVMRNAFRLTYGFGFIYDRNFSDPLLTTPHGNRFTRL